jgi:pyruvate-formate lyase-activating enzyme
MLKNVLKTVLDLTDEQEAKLVDYLDKVYVDIWDIDDVKERLEHNNITATDEECLYVLQTLEGLFDANVGINWDSIDNAIRESGLPHTER